MEYESDKVNPQKELKFSQSVTQSVCETGRTVKIFINNIEYNSDKEMTHSHVSFNPLNKHEHTCDTHPDHSCLDSFQSNF
jgi:hypothetical protein